MDYQAHYKEEKLDALAVSIKCIVDSKVVDIDRALPSQMINVGIRKLHDIAQSPRGKGKYLGHPLWSKNALVILESNGENINGITKYLSHEHLVPLNIVVDKLLQMPIETPIEAYKSQILEFAVVAIITRDEDEQLRLANLNKTMPQDWCGLDVFARYRKVGLFSELVQA